MALPETLSVKQMATAHEAITALIKDDRENKLVFPSSVRIKLAGNLRKTKPVYEEFSTEKQRLFKEYGEPVLDDKGGDTGSIKLKPENVDRVNKELADALAVDTHQTLNAITEADLGSNQIDIELITVLQDTGLLKE